MREPDWDLLRSFLNVYEEKSLSAAARASGKTQPTVGRHIELLEADLGVPLFVRSATGLTPTEHAEKLLPHAKTIKSTMQSMLRTLSETNEVAAGTVRLTASNVIGVEVLPPMLKKFRDIYPDIDIELLLSNKTENLLQREADLAIRMTEPTQGDLIAHKVTVSRICMFASRDYLKAKGTPKSVADLDNHVGIGPDKSPIIHAVLANTPLSEKMEMFAIRTDDEIAQHELIRNGAGIGGMQKAIAQRDPNLVPVLEDLFDFGLDVWLAMHHTLRGSTPVRLLYDFLRSELELYFTNP